MVHRREVDGSTVVFGNHGALWGNAMTWWDHGTGSIWSQPIGEAIAGPLKGTKVEQLPVTFTTWDAWRSEHPETLALDAPAGRSGFSLEDFVIVVEFGDEAVAYPYPDLVTAGVVNDVVADVPIAIVVDPTSPDRWAVFSRRLDTRVVELEVVDHDLVDVGTQSTWDPQRGIAMSGALVGDVLNKLPGFTAFPGDFPTFWPDGRVWQP